MQRENFAREVAPEGSCRSTLANESAPNARAALPVSVCIPVRNEEENLRSCLESLASFSEVVVVDSRSSDATVSIAEQLSARVLQFDWNGRPPKKRNWVLRSYHFKNPWILFLDADERITPAFVSELRSVLPNTPHDGFWISFDNHFMGSRLRYGDIFRKLSLFRVGAGEYEIFPEILWTDLDMEVHEHPILRGTVGKIGAKLEHHDQKKLKSYLQRHEKYSSWEANRYLWLKNADPKSWDALNRRQRFKYRHLHRFWFSYSYFLLQFILKRGFLDGEAGLRFALLKLRYFQDIRRKIIAPQDAKGISRNTSLHSRIACQERKDFGGPKRE